MIRLAQVVLGLVLALVLAACGPSGAPAQPDGPAGTPAPAASSGY